MISIRKQDNKYSILHGNTQLGKVELYSNANHSINSYVKLDMKYYDNGISAELFVKLKVIAGRPLQAMVDSDDDALVDFLLAGGFVCKRKCYEVEAFADDYIGDLSDTQLFRCSVGKPDYDDCCSLMYRYYVDTHKSINPWTSDYAAFCSELPDNVVYGRCGNQIAALAFVEDNEIAYVSGTEKKYFFHFAKSLISSILTQYESIFFEADDCDWAAMMLRSLFENQDDTSYDTYILGDTP